MRPTWEMWAGRQGEGIMKQVLANKKFACLQR